MPGVVLLTEKLADSGYEISFQLDLNKQVICKVSLRNTSNLKKFTRSSFWLLLDYTFIFQDVYNSGTPPYHPTTLILRTVVLDLRKSPFFSLFYIIITITKTRSSLWSRHKNLIGSARADSNGCVFWLVIECFHMTSRRPYWCPKTMKQRPCLCLKPVLWELNSFLMQTLSFVPINLHRCWPREWKRSIEHACSAFQGLHQTSNFSWDESNPAS